MKSACPQGRKERGKSGPGRAGRGSYFSSTFLRFYSYFRKTHDSYVFPIVILFWATYDLTRVSARAVLLTARDNFCRGLQSICRSAALSKVMTAGGAAELSVRVNVGL